MAWVLYIYRLQLKVVIHVIMYPNRCLYKGIGIKINLFVSL